MIDLKLWPQERGAKIDMCNAPLSPVWPYIRVERHHPGLSELEDPFITAEIEVCKLKETQRVKAEKLQRFQVAVRHRLLASVHEQAQLRQAPQEHEVQQKMRQRRLDYSKSVEERNLHLSTNCGRGKGHHRSSEGIPDRLSKSADFHQSSSAPALLSHVAQLSKAPEEETGGLGPLGDGEREPCGDGARPAGGPGARSGQDGMSASGGASSAVSQHVQGVSSSADRLQDGGHASSAVPADDRGCKSKAGPTLAQPCQSMAPGIQANAMTEEKQKVKRSTRAVQVTRKDSCQLDLTGIVLRKSEARMLQSKAAAFAACRDKIKAAGCKPLPPLCACHELDILDPRYPYRCASNCPLYRNSEEYERLLRMVLAVRGLTLPV